MDLMCALHLDRPEHLHIHFQFAEKEPKVKNKRAAGYIYRKKGKMPLEVIDKMTERLNAYTIDDDLAKKRQKVVDNLKRTSNEYGTAHINDILRNWIKELADELPKDKPLWYASKEMVPYRSRIDTIVEWLIDLDDKTREADNAFRDELRAKEKKLTGVMSNYYKERRERELHNVQNLEGFTEISDGLKTLHTIEALEWDYKRRLGNIVLYDVQRIQRATYKRNPRKKYKTNDKVLKRSLAISARKVRGIMDGMFSSVGNLFMPETLRYSNRLREIEKEMEQAHAEEEQKNSQPVRSKWGWGK